MELITAAAQVYVPNFLPGFEVLYIDATDGQRVTPEQEQALKKAGITIQLGDSMPDILLWNQKTDKLWVVEAVTSDGEVDLHKVQGLTSLAERLGKKGVGFTTAYMTWRDATNRQGKLVRKKCSMSGRCPSLWRKSPPSPVRESRPWLCSRKRT